MIDLKQLSIKDTVLLIPYGVKTPTFVNNLSTIVYTITNGKMEYDELPKNSVISIYAPGLLGIWLRSKPDWKQLENAQLLIDKSVVFNNLSKKLIQYRLLLEKFRLGSDVPSLYLQRIAHKQGYQHMIKDITIADWLACLAIFSCDKS